MLWARDTPTITQLITFDGEALLAVSIPSSAETAPVVSDVSLRARVCYGPCLVPINSPVVVAVGCVQGDETDLIEQQQQHVEEEEQQQQQDAAQQGVDASDFVLAIQVFVPTTGYAWLDLGRGLADKQQQCREWLGDVSQGVLQGSSATSMGQPNNKSNGKGNIVFEMSCGSQRVSTDADIACNKWSPLSKTL